MRLHSTALTLVLLSLGGVSEAKRSKKEGGGKLGGFLCRDRDPQCGQWFQNMGGNCRGRDYRYMLERCPETCSTRGRGDAKFCGEAAEAWRQGDGKHFVDIDPYAALGIEASTATTRQIKSAYRKLSLANHPDKQQQQQQGKGGGEAERAAALERFKAAAAAFELIGDEDQRALFDAFRQQKFHSRWQFDQAMARGDIPRSRVAADGLYKSEGSPVVTIDKSNGARYLEGKAPVFVKFYAPWCGHCQDGAAEFKKAAVLIDSLATVAAVNCDAVGWCGNFGVRGYPQIRLLWGKKNVDDTYEGEHEAQAMFKYVALSLMVKVHTLSAKNFDDKVMGSNAMWLVDFSAGSWCGPCQMIKQELRTVARELHGIANVGIINCDKERELCGRFSVEGYPHLKVFPRGPSKKNYQSIEAHGQGFGAGLKLFNIVAKAALEHRECFDEAATREKLQAIYTTYNKSKISEIDILLQKHKGNEDQLVKNIALKYNISDAELKKMTLESENEDDMIPEFGDEDDDEGTSEEGDGGSSSAGEPKEEL
jgi:curved DNA-binding protein CbpA